MVLSSRVTPVSHSPRAPHKKIARPQALGVRCLGPVKRRVAMRKLRQRSVLILSAALICAANPALAQKQGGILRMYIWDNPPSASIHEEATVSTVTPFMSIYNNLVLYDQHQKLNTAE